MVASFVRRALDNRCLRFGLGLWHQLVQALLEILDLLASLLQFLGFRLALDFKVINNASVVVLQGDYICTVISALIGDDVLQGSHDASFKHANATLHVIEDAPLLLKQQHPWHGLSRVTTSATLHDKDAEARDAMSYRATSFRAMPISFSGGLVFVGV